MTGRPFTPGFPSWPGFPLPCSERFAGPGALSTCCTVSLDFLTSALGKSAGEASAQVHHSKITLHQQLALPAFVDGPQAAQYPGVLALDDVLRASVLGPPLEMPPQARGTCHAPALDVAEIRAVLVDGGHHHDHSHHTAGGTIGQVEPERCGKQELDRRFLAHLTVWQNPHFCEAKAFFEIFGHRKAGEACASALRCNTDMDE